MECYPLIMYQSMILLIAQVFTIPKRSLCCVVFTQVILHFKLLVMVLQLPGHCAVFYSSVYHLDLSRHRLYITDR